MKLIDANVVIYAQGRDHEYREPCRSVMVQVVDGAIQANIDVEVLQEVLHYYHSQKRTETALASFDELAQIFPDPLPTTLSIAAVARDLLSQYSSLQSRDAFHAAAVFQYDLEGIISADRGFDAIQGLTRFDPKELAA